MCLCTDAYCKIFSTYPSMYLILCVYLIPASTIACGERSSTESGRIRWLVAGRLGREPSSVGLWCSGSEAFCSCGTSSVFFSRILI